MPPLALLHRCCAPRRPAPARPLPRRVPRPLLRPPPPAASGGGDGPSIWDSDVVRSEFETLMRDFKELMNLQRRFPAFDPDGKTIYLNNLDGLADRMNVFVTRMRLSDDASSRAWLHTLNVQLLEAGLSVDTLAAGLKASTDMMRRWVEEEAAVAHDPAARAALRSKLEAYFDAAPDVEALLADPAVAPALADPLVLAALRDAVADLDAAEKKYGDNPAVAALLRRLREGRKGR